MSDPTKYTLAELNAHLAESEEDVRLGRTEPMQQVLGRLQATIARLEARLIETAEAETTKP